MFSISEFIKINRPYFIWALFLGTLYMFRDMFGLVFLTFIMCFMVMQITRYFRRKYHINRQVVIIVVYAFFLGLITLFLIHFPAILLSETMNFTEQMTHSMQALHSWFTENWSDNEVLMALRDQLEERITPEKSVVSAWNMLRGVLEKILRYVDWFFLAMLFSFLILLDLPRLSRGVRHLRCTRLADTYREVSDSIVLFAKIVGENFRAQLIISTVNTILTAIGLHILHVNAIALLCMVVFICGLIPVLGMIISSVPIVLMSINSGGIELGLWALVMIILIHMLETYVLNPRIVSSVMRINPVMTLIILFVAHSLMGLWGMLLGVPISVYLYRKIDTPVKI